MAVEVVAAATGGGSAGHGRRPAMPRVEWQLGQVSLLVRDGVPDGEAMPTWPRIAPVEQDATVAGVDGMPARAAVGRVHRVEGGRRDEVCRGHWHDAYGLDEMVICVPRCVVVSDLAAPCVDHAEQGSPAAVELAEPAVERGARDEAAPELADESGADEARGVVRREAEEDLFHELLHQLRRLRRHAYLFLVARSVAEGSEDVRSDETLYICEEREELDQTLVVFYFVYTRTTACGLNKLLRDESTISLESDPDRRPSPWIGLRRGLQIDGVTARWVQTSCINKCPAGLQREEEGSAWHQHWIISRIPPSVNVCPRTTTQS